MLKVFAYLWKHSFLLVMMLKPLFYTHADMSDDVYGHSVEDYDMAVSPSIGNVTSYYWQSS